MIANGLIAGGPNGFDIQIHPSSDGVIVTENTIVGASQQHESRQP